MPVDTNLTVQPSVEPANVVDQASKALALRDMVSQIGLRNAQTQQFQAEADQRNRDIADQNTVQGLLKDPATAKAIYGGDMSPLHGKVQPKTVDAMQTAINTAIEKKAQLTTTQLSQEQTAHTEIGKTLDAIDGMRNPDGTLDVNWANQALPGAIEHLRPHLQVLGLDPAKMQNHISSEDDLKTIGTNAGALSAMTDAALARKKEKAATLESTAKGAQSQAEADKANFELQLMKGAGGSGGQDAAIDQRFLGHPEAAQAAKDAWRTNLPAGVKAATEAVNQVYEDQIGAAKKQLSLTSLPTGDLAYYMGKKAATIGKKVDELTPEESLAFQKQYKMDTADPDLRASRLANTQMEVALHQMQLNQMPTREQATDVADDLVHHRLAPDQLTIMSGSFGSQGAAFKRMVYEEAKKKDPNFDFEQASAEYGLVKSPQFQNTVRNMDSITGSLNHLQTNADALGNTGERSLNKLINAGKNELNNVDLKKFQTDKVLLSEEIGRLMAGGGTGSGTSDKKLEMAGSLLKDSDDPKAISSSIQEVKTLLGNRRDSLTKGTYMENQSMEPTNQTEPNTLSSGHKVGDTVTVKGKPVKITKVLPGDKFEYQ